MYAHYLAQHNAESIKNLRLGLLVSGALSILLRLLFRRGSLSPKQLSFWIYVFSLVPSVFLSRYLERIGSPRRDPTTGTLISAGEDLSRPGIIEWCFDVIYITCEFIQCEVCGCECVLTVDVCRGMPSR